MDARPWGHGKRGLELVPPIGAALVATMSTAGAFGMA